MKTIKTVLLIEDSPGDVRLTRKALREADGAMRLLVAVDGVEAISFLRRQGVHACASRPDLILLDLNVPRMDGRQVLAAIKQHDDLTTIPTLVLTNSDPEEDIETVYELRANCYLIKPVEFDAFEGLVKGISDFWLTKASFPQRLRTA